MRRLIICLMAHLFAHTSLPPFFTHSIAVGSFAVATNELTVPASPINYYSAAQLKNRQVIAQSEKALTVDLSGSTFEIGDDGITALVAFSFNEPVTLNLSNCRFVGNSSNLLFVERSGGAPATIVLENADFSAMKRQDKIRYYKNDTAGLKQLDHLLFNNACQFVRRKCLCYLKPERRSN